MSKEIEKQIENIYSKVFAKVYNGTNIAKLSKGERIDILQLVSILETSPTYEKFAKKFAKELAKKGIKYQRGLWKKYYKAAKKMRYVGLKKNWKQFEAEQLSKAVKHNFEMIKSIPRRTVEIMEHKYTSTLIEEVAKGKLNRGSFRKQLQSHGHKNAKLIARTETAKLQTAILKNRAVDIGSVAYIWRSSNDNRTRPSHKAMNNVIVFWRETDLEKPLLDKMYGDAGEFPNCRCSPQPILDRSDLTKSFYKVYNYKEHKIVTMGKRDVIAALEKKSL